MSDESKEEVTEEIESPPPTYPWEGVAALILALGADRDEVSKVWDAMQYTALPRDPMDAIRAFDHAIALVKSGEPTPGRPDNFPETARDKDKIEAQMTED